MTTTTTSTTASTTNTSSNASSSVLTHVVQSQLESLDDTDCYASVWQLALEKASTNAATGNSSVTWGGRGQGGRGRARRTFQPTDIVVQDLRLEYVGSKQRVLLDQATLKLAAGQVYALIGRNGSGKSSLLRRIDAGRIPGFPPHITTLYVPQETDESYFCSAAKTTAADEVVNKNRTPLELLLHQHAAYSKKSAAALQLEVDKLQEEMDQLNLELADDQVRMEELAEQISNLEDNGDDNDDDQQWEREAQEALRFVGLTDETLWTAPLSSLSPGLRKRVLLAIPLVCPSRLLLLDEPTNHLDVAGLLMLRQLIEYCSGQLQTTILMVSHDRDLMDDVADHVIDFFDQTLLYSPGNFSDYERLRQQTDLCQLRQAVALEKKRGAMMRTLDHLLHQPTPKRKGGAKKKAKQVACQRKKLNRVGLEKDEKGHYRTHQKAGTGIQPGSINAVDASTRGGSKKKGGLTTQQLLELTRKSIRPPPEKAIQFVFRNTTCQWNEPVIVAYDVGHGYNIPSSDQKDNEEPTATGSNGATQISTGAKDHDNNDPDTSSLAITKKEGYLFDCVDLCVEEGGTYCILGPSASGKSTLLRLLAKLEEPVEGTISHALNLDVALLDQHKMDELVLSATATDHDDDDNALSYLTKRYPTKTEQAIRGELTNFGLNPQQATSTSLRFLSGGERARLLLAAAMLGDPQVLVLDEPCSNLDVESVQALVYGLSRWNGTTVMVSHDVNFIRSLMNDDNKDNDKKKKVQCFALVESEGKLRRIPGGVDDYLRAFG